MPKPKNKKELLEQSQDSFEQLQGLLATYSTSSLENKLFTNAALYKNVRDVLAHMHHWHLLFLGWYEIGMQGQKPQMPAEGYTWRTVPALNEVIWKQYNNKELQKIQGLFETSHQEIMACIELHSNRELFEKKYYHWTGSTSLGAYITSATVSHYKWAHKKIKKTLPH